MVDKDLAQKAATLEKELRGVLSAIKGGWHENDETEFTQRFGVAYINHLEKILIECKPCDHIWRTDNSNGSSTIPTSVICGKCGYKP